MAGDVYGQVERELEAVTLAWGGLRTDQPDGRMAGDFDWLARRLDRLAARARGVADAYRP